MTKQTIFENGSLKDNHRSGRVGDFLIDNITPAADLSFVSAYFTIYAYDALKDKLNSINKLRFLFGDPTFVDNIDPEKSERKQYAISEEGLDLKKKIEQKGIAKECAKWIENKVEIKSMKQTNLLHGKFYHIENNGKEKAIIGSSNFTKTGLGLATKSNIELNLIVNDERDKTEIKTWFDNMWESEDLVEDVRHNVLEYLAKLYVDNPPQLVYYKTLYHIFEQFLKEQDNSITLDERVRLTDSFIWNTLYSFQQHGAKSAINRLLNYNGCIIADSVGLGKTYTALAVIKYFELKNQDVLVLCPKKLRQNWTIYKDNSELNPFQLDRFRYTVLNHTDLTREQGMQGDVNLETINWSNYNLVVIDESHNFRNNTKGKKSDKDGKIKMSRYEKLMESILKSGVKTKVLLLSATPVNNNLKDLRNQILLFTEGNENGFSESLGIENLASLLKDAQTKFTNWAKKKKDSSVTSKELIDDMPPMFFKLLDELTIARSRKHIKKYYKDELARIGAFPQRSNLKPINPQIDNEDNFLSYDKINDEIEKYQLAIFNPSKYVQPSYFDNYSIKPKADKSKGSYGDTQTRENYLIGMMKVNFLKRLESSIESFEITMNRTLGKVKEKIALIEQYQKAKQDKINTKQQFETDNGITTEEADGGSDEEESQLFETGTKLKYNLEHLDCEQWLIDLKKDKDQLLTLYNAAKGVTPDRDAKLSHLKAIIKDKVQNPTINQDGKANKKILIFTAFADTAEYLYESIKSWVRDELHVDIALVSGGGANKSTYSPKGFNFQAGFEQVLTNFSPMSRNRSKIKTMPQQGEIDILIATDCISEGQNLQDCDYMVNYDIHWNPVRIIQRFGRIDRIGSRNSKIFMQNFWPTDDLNKYINLKSRVEARMALVDITATGEDDLLNQEQIHELIETDMKYRDKQLIKLKTEILELEDMDDNISLTDFNLEDFRIDLLKFIDSNKELLHNTPMGLYSIVPSPDSEFSGSINYDILNDASKQVIKPGIIFCLKHKQNAQDNKKLNMLYPYYLVYIRDDGEVRYNYTNAKNILEIYKIMCLGNLETVEELFRLFDKETDNGKDMHLQTALLESACNTIINSMKRKNNLQLLSGRNAEIIAPSKQAKGYSDFELITWLIIK